MLSKLEWEDIRIKLLELYMESQKNEMPAGELEKKLAALLIEKDKNLYDKICSQINEAGKMFNLSTRECEVLKQLLEGRTNLEISEILSVSISTVKKHVYNIFNKAGVNNRTQLLNFVYTINAK